MSLCGSSGYKFCGYVYHKLIFYTCIGLIGPGGGGGGGCGTGCTCSRCYLYCRFKIYYILLSYVGRIYLLIVQMLLADMSRKKNEVKVRPKKEESGKKRNPQPSLSLFHVLLFLCTYIQIFFVPLPLAKIATPYMY